MVRLRDSGYSQLGCGQPAGAFTASKLSCWCLRYGAVEGVEGVWGKIGRITGTCGWGIGRKGLPGGLGSLACVLG